MIRLLVESTNLTNVRSSLLKNAENLGLKQIDLSRHGLYVDWLYYLLMNQLIVVVVVMNVRVTSARCS